jgi:hypothetical protein
VAARRELVAEQGQGVFIPPPPPTSFGIPENHTSADWVTRRLTRLDVVSGHRTSVDKGSHHETILIALLGEARRIATNIAKLPELLGKP